ncbi:hypothetical protein HYT25_04640 [Candidatus Pacearchaeota archaeon]|nr:hypothetical protein [Candidatus Pacearchaeota archaeon]
MEQANINKVNEELTHLKREFAKMKTLLEDDLEFARKTEEAWQEIDDGKFKEMPSEEFLKEIEKW